MNNPAKKHDDAAKKLDWAILKTAEWFQELTVLKSELDNKKKKPYITRVK